VEGRRIQVRQTWRIDIEGSKQLHYDGGKIIKEAINDEVKFYFWEFERKSIKNVVKDLRNSNVCELKLK